MADSEASSSLIPRESKNLIPLSANGLWEAETTAARSKLTRGASTDAAGVGRTPPSIASPPPAAIPAASASSSIGPDSRVSRTIRTCGRSASWRSAAARPSRTARSGVSNSPTGPRTPSVPKSWRWTGLIVGRGRRQAPVAAVSALAELRLLAGLLQPSLAALLDPGVPGQHAPALQLGAKSRVDLGQRTGD